MVSSIYKPKKILIIAPSWVGDMVMAQALFLLLRQRYSGVLIDVLAAPYLHAFLRRMPEVNRCIELPFAHGALNLLGRYHLGHKLRQESYDQAIILPNSFKSALIPFWAKIPQRIGWRGEMRYGLINDLRILDKKQLPQMLQRFLSLGIGAQENLPKNLPYPKLQTTQSQIVATLQKLGLLQLSTTNKPILMLCPGAEYGPAKRWPAEHFAAVAKNKAAADWLVVIVGGQNDQIVAQEIQELSGNICINLVGRTDLAEVVDILALASYVISNDSGLMHVAAALDCTLIAIYGSSSAEFTPPLGKKVTILSLDLPCRPCFQRVCPLGNARCLQELSPQIIIDEINKNAAKFP